MIEHDINDAAALLHTTPPALRQRLVDAGAIRKTNFGWEAMPAFIAKHLLRTDQRQTTIKTAAGQQVPRYYTVVMISDAGIFWLQEAAQAAEVAAAAKPLAVPMRRAQGNVFPLEFCQPPKIPTRPCCCIVLDSRHRFVPCVASFDGDHFLGFIPASSELAQPLPETAVVGWAELPPADSVFNQLVSSAAA
jgi:hypothetical protein